MEVTQLNDWLYKVKFESRFHDEGVEVFLTDSDVDVLVEKIEELKG